jgi:hypothetical protein
MRLEIAVAARTHDREGITAPRGLDLHFLDRLLQRFGVVERADADAREAAQRIAVERRNAGGKSTEPTRYCWPSSILKVTRKPLRSGSYSVSAATTCTSAKPCFR